MTALTHSDGVEAAIENKRASVYRFVMSVGEIMQELPRLSLAERRMLTNKLLELEPDRAAIETCDQLADEAMQVLDRMEEEDARRAKG